MLPLKSLLASVAIVLALIVTTTGTTEDLEDTDTQNIEIPNDNDITDIEPDDFEALLFNLQKARENLYEDDIDAKRMASGWKRGHSAVSGWKRDQPPPRRQMAASGWKRGNAAASGWKRGQAAASGWKRGQSAASGWKRGQAAASGWKRDPIEVDTRGNNNWRNSQVKSASGWKRTVY